MLLCVQVFAYARVPCRLIGNEHSLNWIEYTKPIGLGKRAGGDERGATARQSDASHELENAKLAAPAGDQA